MCPTPNTAEPIIFLMICFGAFIIVAGLAAMAALHIIGASGLKREHPVKTKTKTKAT